MTIVLIILKALAVAGLPASLLCWARGLLSKPVAIACSIVAGITTLLVVIGLIHGSGEKAGAAKVEAKVAEVHAAAVADARRDERIANDASATIATSTAQQTIAAAAVTHYIIEDLHHAIDDVPPAAPDAALPAAPVDRLRDALNAGVAGANRAADTADALR